VETLEQIKNRAELAARDAKIEIVVNSGPSGQSSLLIDSEHAVEVARFLRDHAALSFDFEVVYHLYSIKLKHGPLIIRMRTANRTDGARLPSLTPVWRSAEFQEREIFDLYGIHFDGHPDLRRILMWDEFKDYPMRKDYVPPDDFEWEPTPHDDVLARAKQHYPARPPETELKPS
jgi:NADH-quinone oxidoreductase subunit C